MGWKGETEQPELRCGIQPQTKHIDPFVASLDSILPLNPRIAQFKSAPTSAKPL